MLLSDKDRLEFKAYESAKEIRGRAFMFAKAQYLKAYMDGAKDMQEHCVNACEKTNLRFAIPFEAVNRCIEAIKSIKLLSIS